jgi:bla regulator protein BlaR1
MTDWLVNAFIATSLLASVVFVVRGPVLRAFGARAAYALWALPLLRMLMPPLPGWHVLYIPVWRLGPDHATVGLVSPDEAMRLAGATPIAAGTPGSDVISAVHVSSVPWLPLVAVVWLAGATFWFGWQMLRYHGFLRHALRSATLLTSECGIDVLLTDHVDGPVAAGVIRRRIFLPHDFMTRYAPRERHLALLHEGAHHDRNDILANLVALVILALHWWNPIAHKAYRLFRADQELACDATVLVGVGNQDRYAYGSAVLKSASARMPGVACALSHKDELKRRIQIMARKPIGWPRHGLGLGIAIAAIGTGLVVTASGFANVPSDAGISSTEIAQIRRQAEMARREGLKAAVDARREADIARREGWKASVQAHREASLARDEAARNSATVRRQMDVALQAEAWRADGAIAREDAYRQLASTRQRMVSACAAKGRAVDPSGSWTTLALCGDDVHAIAQRAIAQARSGIATAYAWRRLDAVASPQNGDRDAD